MNIKGENVAGLQNEPIIASFVLTIVNPCDELVVPEQQLNGPLVYEYTGIDPMLEFAPEGIEAKFEFCPLIFECQIIAGPRLDLCAISESDT